MPSLLLKPNDVIRDITLHEERALTKQCKATVKLIFDEAVSIAPDNQPISTIDENQQTVRRIRYSRATKETNRDAETRKFNCKVTK